MTSTPTRWNSRALHAVAGIITAALAAVPSLERPLFHDEASTWYGTAFGLPHLFSYLDVHPPLYFLLTSAWFEAAGANLIGLRLVSCALLGLALFLFLRALVRLNASPETVRAITLLGATSPFLIFAGSFARYYSFATAAGAAGLWLLARFAQSPDARRAAPLGLLIGSLFLINYPAAVLLGPCFGAAFLCLLPRPRRAAPLAAFFVPAALLILAWIPFFLQQLAQESPSAPAGAVGFMRSLAMATGYLFYGLSVGDGLPPWNPAGLVAGFVMGILFLRGTVFLLARKGTPRRVALACLLLLAGGALLGAVLLPGPRTLFLPPRVAFLAFPFLWIVGTAVAGRGRLARLGMAAALAVHLLGLRGLLVQRDTTVWAYRVPTTHIAKSVRELITEHGASPERPASVWLSVASTRNILFELEPLRPSITVNTLSPDAPLLVVISETRKPAWPPPEAANVEAVQEWNVSDWSPDTEKLFLPEDENVGRMKQRIVGRDVAPWKLHLQAWRPK